jgi:hypothetical protein
MSLELDPPIFEWLKSINLLKEGEQTLYGKISLNEEMGMKFYDGVYLAKIIKLIINNNDAYSF